MLELNEPAMAVPSLEKSLQLDASMSETRFLLAVAQRRLGDTAAAHKNLLAVLAANPLHPRARLELAQLFSDTGKLEQAQAQVLAHIKNYPYERLPGS
jgi:Tfp pilus assembly protein PilF